MKVGARLAAAIALCALAGAASAQKGETVRIAFIDPLSGPFANVGQNQLKSWQYTAERLSADNPAGVKFEVTAFDNKASPQESLSALRAAIDQGFRYVVQGNGSGAAQAIMEAVAKHNARNPGKELVYLDYAAVDPALTNEKCDYWHFRLDADTSMKMEALTSFLREQPQIRKVYLLNQNYSHGHQVASFFKDAVKRRRPDIEIAGEDLHPIGQVKDFAPYVAKMKRAGADAVVTGNWGQDLTLLVRAMSDAGLNVPLYTYYAMAAGTPKALAAGGASEVYVVSYGHPNLPAPIAPMAAEFKKRFNDDYFTFATYNGIGLLAQAMAKAKSTEPAKVAAAMEGLRLKSFAGEVTMRAADHQLQQTMFITRWQKAKPGEYSVEGTGYTFAPVKRLEPYVSTTPTSCEMKRPAGGAAG
ncbi:branched-chain amino acid ABC transporter substrate-binding protein [Mitsuaria sp. GD03876]|uniref:branched-chain amino acid ABC transporter substrate-binding protein n=1 Tax=Mitsuaria sp. GD03876 TaxID=2975399 RepID=UPI00244AEFC8|nr:branched-chain amino acid ABC transporter substrate-binding protein [Mitsuaria sp. GD03876]MDH0866501.1 branched-chain amino acid ABC transporter substrate-binding protein [Mitsuaria sp. GD03876]